VETGSKLTAPTRPLLGETAPCGKARGQTPNGETTISISPPELGASKIKLLGDPAASGHRKGKPLQPGTLKTTTRLIPQPPLNISGPIQPALSFAFGRRGREQPGGPFVRPRTTGFPCRRTRRVISSPRTRARFDEISNPGRSKRREKKKKKKIPGAAFFSPGGRPNPSHPFIGYDPRFIGKNPGNQ